ncbi:MAG: hypothetical protein IJX12_05770 [Lachnospiraceae bacterium]|nr:hypothetical protein [Lachnospiraceae bacterium]
MMGLTVEEMQLASCYSDVSTRLQMMKTIVRERAGLEESVRVIADSLINKLANMKDSEFNSIVFCEEVEW